MNLDGGIHRIPLADVGGDLWLCGKHAIAPDVDSVLEDTGADHVVCLVERYELSDRYPQYVHWLETSGSATWYPIADLDFGSVEELSDVLAMIRDLLRRGRSIVVHCAAGRGRAGTLAVAICQDLGMPLEAALQHVRAHRPGAGPEVGAQMDFVKNWEHEVRGRH